MSAKTSAVAAQPEQTPVLGLLKRGGKVYAKVIPDARQRTLMGIIQEKVVPDSILYSDSYTVYDVLDVSSFKHFRINHSRILPTVATTPNGIENFCQPGEAPYA